MKPMTNLGVKFTPTREVRPVSMFMLLLSLIFITACAKDDANVADNPDSLTIAQVVSSGDSFIKYGETTTATDVTGTETTQNETYDGQDSDGNNNDTEERWVCTEKEVDITGGTQEFPLFNTNVSVIWPGNLLQSKTLDEATPSDIVVKRAAGTITYNLINGNPNATKTVDAIDQGSVQQAMNDIVKGSIGDPPANFTLDISAINSKEELALKMKIKAESLGKKVSGSFSYNSSMEVSSVLVKLTQQYYTMSYVKPTSLSEVFDPSVTSDDLVKFIQTDNPATFISSVTYGRIFYMLYESTASAKDMSATLKGSYDAVVGSVKGSAKMDKLREFNNLTVKVIAYGGDSKGSLTAVGDTFGGDNAVDNLQDIVGRLAEASDIEGGLPLSYVVNSLEDPSQIVSTNLATRYTVKTCEEKGTLPPLAYRPLVGLFEDGIGAAFQVKENINVFYNKAGDKYAYYNFASGEAPIVYSAVNNNGPISSSRFILEPIGAAVRWREDRILLFNINGDQLMKFNYNLDSANLESPNGGIGWFEEKDFKIELFSTSTYYSTDIKPQNEFPFANGGINAAIQYVYKLGRDIIGPVSVNGSADQRYFSNDGKNTATLRDRINDIDGADDWEWGANDSVVEDYFKLSSFEDANFINIGAATHVDFGGGTTENIYFNMDGDQMIIKNNGNISGPYFVK